MLVANTEMAEQSVIARRNNGVQAVTARYTVEARRCGPDTAGWMPAQKNTVAGTMVERSAAEKAAEEYRSGVGAVE